MLLRGLLTSTCIEWRGMISCFKSLPILVRAVSFTERNWISKQYVKTYSFFFKSKKLGRITKKLIRKSTKCSQSRWRVEERMFRLIHDLFLIIKRFFSFLKGKSYSCDTELQHFKQFKKWWQTAPYFLRCTVLLIKSEIPIYSPFLTRRCLIPSSQYDSFHNLHWNL